MRSCPVAYPSERLALDAGDATLEAIEWLTPDRTWLACGDRRARRAPARPRSLGACSARSPAARVSR